MKNSRAQSMNRLADRLEDNLKKYAGSEQYDVPLKCKLGYHDYGPLVKVRVRHESKPNDKNKWAHMCGAERKYCKKCGHNSALEKICTPPITPIFEEQLKIKPDLGIDPSAPRAILNK